ncbi:MAG TPA: GGDEF domain-containing protein, partial [Kofleriaceae bacterium]|nr:GGDEF domain-containing protein [Kofleriaceae bacterium]
VTGAWVLVALGAWRSRRHDSPGGFLAIVTVTLYCTTLASFTLVTGPFAAAGWIAMVGGAVVGYVLFPRWLALAGCAWYVLLVVGLSIILGDHDWPALDTIAPAYAYAHLDRDEVIRQATGSLALSVLTFSVIAYVVDRWRDREARVMRLAETDALTSLTNRRRFLEIAERELARSRRYKSPLALILIDLDHFKNVNDRFGHLAGDQVLIAAAKALAGGLRDVDVIARHGGEEFAILLPETDLAGGREVAERSGRRLAETTILVDNSEPVHVTASMGVAATGGDRAMSLDDLLRRADAALYVAKRGGRDRVETAA